VLNSRLSRVLLAVAGLAISTPALAAFVFINEIHYDNAGADVGEAIEIGGASNVDLTDWALVLYNGNGGGMYRTVALGLSTLPDQQNGYGTAAFFIPGIQNGSPDGIALVDGTDAVVQFLSYEGSFTAVDGPAAGLTSTDIGVSEASSTPVGHSLQLAGLGAVAADFAWAGPLPESFGSVNDAQAFVPIPPAGLLLAPCLAGLAAAARRRAG
jgi:hypothetical protein